MGCMETTKVRSSSPEHRHAQRCLSPKEKHAQVKDIEYFTNSMENLHQIATQDSSDISGSSDVCDLPNDEQLPDTMEGIILDDQHFPPLQQQTFANQSINPVWMELNITDSYEDRGIDGSLFSQWKKYAQKHKRIQRHNANQSEDQKHTINEGKTAQSTPTNQNTVWNNIEVSGYWNDGKRTPHLIIQQKKARSRGQKRPAQRVRIHKKGAYR